MQPCFVWLAITANELGLEEEARSAADRLLEINPQFGKATILRIFPFAQAEDAERFVDMLRRADVPVDIES